MAVDFGLTTDRRNTRRMAIHPYGSVDRHGRSHIINARRPPPVEKRACRAGSRAGCAAECLNVARAIDDAFAQRRGGAMVPQNGARVVAKAWTDPAFRRRLLENGTRTPSPSWGLAMPAHHRHPRRPGEQPAVHNVYRVHAVLLHRFQHHRHAAGLAKDFERPRAGGARVADRAARDGARSAAGDGGPRLGHDRGHALHGALPVQPPRRIGWPEEKLAEIVTKDSMIGVSRPLASPVTRATSRH